MSEDTGFKGGYGMITGKEGNTFSSSNQPTKRRGKSILSMVRKKLYDEKSFIDLHGVDEIDEDGNVTGRLISVRVKMVNAEALTMNYINRLQSSDALMKDFLDREEGKPTVFIERGDNTAPTIDIEERRQIAMQKIQEAKKVLQKNIEDAQIDNEE